MTNIESFNIGLYFYLYFIAEKVDLKNETAYLVAKRRAVLENIIAATKEHETRAAANQAILEAQVVFKENQLLHRQLVQARLEKIRSGASSTPQASSSDSDWHPTGFEAFGGSPNRGFISPNVTSAHRNESVEVV